MALTRLVTWNQFFSASAYEREEPISWSMLEDLSSLIDLLCMYDLLRVIGDPDQPPFLTHATDFFGAMRGSRAIEVQAPSGSQLEALREATRLHLRACLPAVPVAQLDAWLSDAFRLNEVPSDRECVATLNAGVRIEGALDSRGKDLSAVATMLCKPNDPVGLRPFVCRTFMYLAYAELERIPFAADSTRRALASSVLSYETDLAAQMLDRLASQWRHHPSVGAVRLRSRISPFSAVVLERCCGDRGAIPDEILQLREELQADRGRIAELEQKIRSAEDRDEAVRVDASWLSVLAEIERSYGPSPRLVSFQTGLALASSAADAVGNPRDAADYLKLATLPAQIVRRLFRRAPVAQIHRLRRQLPSADRLVTAIYSVFPEVERLPAP